MSNPGDQASVGSTSVSLALPADVASGYTAAYSASGLPTGLSINSSTGVISGTLSGGDTGHTYRVLVTATASGVSSTQEFGWRVGNVVLKPPGNQTNMEGDSISFGVTAGAASGTLSYHAAGTPAGVVINSSTGAFNGLLVPGDAGNYVVTVWITNGTYSDSQSFFWTVNPKFVVDSIDHQLNFEGDSISISVTATEPGATLAYSATGLPSGATINSSTGVISGSVSAGDAAAGPYLVNVTVSDGTFISTVSFPWTVWHGSNHAPVLNNPGTQTNLVGDSVYLPLSASDADSDTIAIFADGLPDGLSIDSSTGVISGILANDALRHEPYTITVYADDANGGADSMTFIWIVNDSALTVSATSLSTVAEGADPGDVTVATFTNSNPNWTASDFSATINWGDGTTDDGFIEGANGSYMVTGRHAYDHPGSYAPGITVSDAFITGSATGSASVTTAAITVIGGMRHGTIPGTAVNGTWAAFTDDNPNDASGNYTATINWGDGTSSIGMITGSNGSFQVSGSHTYANHGAETVTVTVVDQDGTTDSDTSIAQVGDAFAGVNTALTVATFSSANTSASASAYTAQINWGDGTTSSGTVTGSAGAFTVNGTHTYAVDSLDEAGGVYAVTTELDGPNSEALVAHNGVAVVRPAVKAYANDVLAQPGVAFSNAQVATLTEADVTDTTGEFTATIDWGDGTSNVGTITGSAGLFQVLGSHSYTYSGIFNIEVALEQAWSTFSLESVLNSLAIVGNYASAPDAPKTATTLIKTDNVTVTWDSDKFLTGFLNVVGQQVNFSDIASGKIQGLPNKTFKLLGGLASKGTVIELAKNAISASEITLGNDDNFVSIDGNRTVTAAHVAYATDEASITASYSRKFFSGTVQAVINDYKVTASFNTFPSAQVSVKYKDGSGVTFGKAGTESYVSGRV